MKDNGNLYRIKTNGTAKKQLTSCPVDAVNVVGNWIYYHNTYDGAIYKMKTNGTDCILLDDAANDYVYAINVVGDWIYYLTNYSLTKACYKMRTDGTEHQEVN